MRFIFSFFLCFIIVDAWSQLDSFGIKNENKVINMKKAISKIVLDGNLDEDAWLDAEIGDDFWVKFPTNTRKSTSRTEVKVTYDDKNMYFGFKVMDIGDELLVQSLKRDLGLRVGDGVAIIMDPIGEQTNGFYFGLTPYNSQTEGLIGARNADRSNSWDNKWFSQTKVYKEFWTAEIAIPFSILRYDDQKMSWGLNFMRNDRKLNEFLTWTNMPLQFRGTDLGYIGTLNWDAPPPRAGRNIMINPYITGGVSQNKEDGEPVKATGNAGFDAKVAINSSLNLDLTVNPDFSQVDVDRQVTNLTRFSIFFPERRVFFLENDDIFSSYGIPPIRPFYSRRIGSKSGQNVPIYAGGRLSGNINKDLRIGLMNIQTGGKDDLAGDNFTSVSFNQRVLARSLVKGYFNNRISMAKDSEFLEDPFEEFGRNAGLELRLQNKTGTWSGWSGNHISWKPGIDDKNMFYNLGVGYAGRNLESLIDLNNIGTNYYADMGFVNRINNYDALRDTSIRQGYDLIFNANKYTIRNNSPAAMFNRIEFNLNNIIGLTDKHEFNERTNELDVRFNKVNSSRIRLQMTSTALRLQYPFRIVDDEEKPPLPAGDYNYNFYGLEYRSDVRKSVAFRIEGNIGKLYSADFRQVRGTFIARKQPYFTLEMMLEYNSLVFPDPYGEQDFFLVAPQIEFNISNKLFWTSFVQYNSQANNFNINSRVQWRYASMSDLFLVYSDNYFTDPLLKNKNRAIVLKTNYWLNM